MAQMTLLSLLINFILVVLISMSQASDLLPAPALIWGGSNPDVKIVDVNPLAQTSELEFQKVVEQRFGAVPVSTPPPIIVFIKDNLCIEDFTQNPTNFKRLIKAGSLQHFSAVEAPLIAFDKLSLYNRSEEEKPSSISDGQLISTRATDFDAISNTYNALRESSPNLIGAFIGKSCSKSERRKRAAVDKKSTTDSFIFPGNKYVSRMLLYADGAITWERNSADPKVPIYNLTMADLENAVESGAGTAASPLLVNMTFNVEGRPTFRFELGVSYPKYYSLKKIEYFSNGNNTPDILTTMSDIDIPYNSSYHCTPEVVFKSSKSGASLKFKNIQIQLDALKFGEAFDCVGFMSIPILSGIFVILILALIMIWGLSFILDIRTMDRFDDPKAKTITISAQE